LAAPHALESARITDEELVVQLCAGNEAAFELVYERYFPRVYAFVERRLRNRADTEETVQEVFINVFSSIASFRGEAPFAAWVFGLTRRTIAARFKRKRHATVPLLDDEQDRDGVGGAQVANANPLEAYEFQERLDEIATRVSDRLSDEQQQLFQLHHLENRSIGDIARSLHKSEDSIKSNLYRARKILLAR
jgi:RNA polymerase sigma-70 factor (ECF subfamily)